MDTHLDSDLDSDDLELELPRQTSDLYRQFFAPAECRRLDETPPESALSELALLRVLIARLLGVGKRGRITLARRFSMLVAFSQSAVTMASLARIERQVNPPEDAVLLALAEMDEDPQ